MLMWSMMRRGIISITNVAIHSENEAILPPFDESDVSKLTFRIGDVMVSLDTNNLCRMLKHL